MAETQVFTNGRLVPRPVIESSQIADLVNQPPHYKQGGIEVIDFIEAKHFNYNCGNAIKYISRADFKGNKIQDLEKAVWYLLREISNLKKA